MQTDTVCTPQVTPQHDPAAAQRLLQSSPLTPSQSAHSALSAHHVDPAVQNGVYCEDPAVQHGVYYVDPAVQHGVYYEDPAVQHGVYCEDPAVQHGVYYEDPACSATWCLL